MSQTAAPEPVTARGRRTREALLSAARTTFETRGYRGTTMSDVADEASVSHGTVYTYFAGKEPLLEAVCTIVAGEVFAAVRVPDDLRSDPVTRIEEGNRRYLRVYAKHARMLEVLEEAAAADPRFRARIDELRAGFVEKARGTLVHFQTDGLADRGIDPELAAPALVGMVESFARRWHALGETLDPEEVVRTLTRLWVGAIGLHRPDQSPAQQPRPQEDPAA